MMSIMWDLVSRKQDRREDVVFLDSRRYEMNEERKEKEFID